MKSHSATEFTSPGQILSMSSGYWRSCTIQAAVKLDLFTVIGKRAVSGAEIASQVGGDERGVTTLLNAIVALGLLEKNHGKFSNTELTAACLLAALC